MRSIGKRNIRKLKELVQDEMAACRDQGVYPHVAKERIACRIPREWYDIWESAHDEIERIVSDEIWAILNARPGI